jgi:N-acetylglucosaminyldiphosphoundecaprenol N-acetyl-beta-D-mannosaminyltransferase
LGVFILGGRGATAALAVEKMKFKYKNINIIGYSSEYSSGAEDDAKTVKFILKCLHDVKVNHIDLLLVGYGHSKQEKWISRNADAINANVCVGVGGFLDVEAQLVKEAPKYIKRMGLEWLHRLVTQRWRYKRVWNAVAVFLTKVLLSS